MTERVSYRQIYAEHADRYDELVRHEDCDGELALALGRCAPLEGQKVVDVGAGTGRVTRVLLEAGANVVAVEPADAMRVMAQRLLAGWPSDRLTVVAGDARDLPLADSSVDMAVAGWVIGHFRSWFAPDWRVEVDRALAEVERVVRPGGALLVIETLGTGTDAAAPPTPELAEYARHLEERGFRRQEIRTDYAFESVEEAARICGFFFGNALADRIRDRCWARVPEHTGLWLGKAP